jgi:allantoin racemase
MTQTEAPKRRILVINPSSSLAVTKAIDAAVHPLGIAGGPEVGVDCLREGRRGSRRSATPTA